MREARRVDRVEFNRQKVAKEIDYPVRLLDLHEMDYPVFTRFLKEIHELICTVSNIERFFKEPIEIRPKADKLDPFRE
jgi:hypothetical protein